MRLHVLAQTGDQSLLERPDHNDRHRPLLGHLHGLRGVAAGVSDQEVRPTVDQFAKYRTNILVARAVGHLDRHAELSGEIPSRLDSLLVPPVVTGLFRRHDPDLGDDRPGPRRLAGARRGRAASATPTQGKRQRHESQHDAHQADRRTGRR